MVPLFGHGSYISTYNKSSMKMSIKLKFLLENIYQFVGENDTETWTLWQMFFVNIFKNPKFKSDRMRNPVK